MKTISFDTTLSTFGKNTGIEIPNEIMKQLDAGRDLLYSSRLMAMSISVPLELWEERHS